MVAHLRIWINGRSFIARGGNWGFGESMLRYRAREYDAAVRYHREMNFTMIRNWVGQIGDEAFYEACDRHGIVVWQDFWLANPWDGPEPDDNDLFLSNVKDLVLRIRNHPSVGLYCGRNEGFPPPPLEQGIRKILADLHPQLALHPEFRRRGSQRTRAVLGESGAVLLQGRRQASCTAKSARRIFHRSTACA